MWARLGETAWSVGLRESLWIYPIVETAHVLGLALFVGLAVLLDLRLVGLALPRVAVSLVVAQLQPWTWAGFALMVVTGVLLFFSDPATFAANPFFQIKIGLLAVAGLNAWTFHRNVYRTVASWGHETHTPWRARAAGWMSLLVWAGVVATGRLIAFQPR
jgi:hypothetical protein